MQTLDGKAGSSIRSYVSVPMLRSAYRVRHARIPWLSVDPNLAAECSSAVRAVRLVLLALFALFAAPTRSRAAAPDKAAEPARSKLKITSRQEIEWLNTSIAMRQADAQKAEVAYSSAATADEGAIMTGRTERALRDPKRDSSYLKIKRDHAPPQIAEKEELICFFYGLQPWFTTRTHTHSRDLTLTSNWIIDRVTPSPVNAFYSFPSVTDLRNSYALRARYNLRDLPDQCASQSLLPRLDARYKPLKNTFTQGEHCNVSH